MHCSEHLCSLICLLDHECKSQKVRFHFSATKNKSNLVTDSNWRLKATSVKMFCFLAASLQRCLWDMAQTFHVNPLCQCWADSVLTQVGKMGELFFMLFFPTLFSLYTFSMATSAHMQFLSSFVLLHCPDQHGLQQQLSRCCGIFPSPVPAS